MTKLEAVAYATKHHPLNSAGGGHALSAEAFEKLFDSIVNANGGFHWSQLDKCCDAMIEGAYEL